ncbi:hypothetical protein [Archaeoglobus neptunius]|uniref:hypothetical protein n=1 Tax=Archaeoglobus neptunius TaxID=2798580 RepID=UPI0019283347|nr:hypothetical protein [Archaeoglobus neptunius]
MSSRRKYAVMSVLSALAFATIFAVSYYASEADELISARAIFKVYVYKVEVGEKNCTLYVPIPARDGRVLEFADVVNAPKNWSIVDTKYGRMLKIEGDFEAYALSEKPINLSNAFLLRPRFGGGSAYTTYIYSTCNTSIKIRLVGYNEWWEERGIWKKKVKWWECYQDVVDVEVVAGWTVVEGELVAKKCYSAKCIEECLGKSRSEQRRMVL